MPLYDYECNKCGHVEELIKPVNVKTATCSKCGCEARRIVSVAMQECSNDDAAWIRSIVDVVDKESTKPHVVEFIKNPTRTNYKNWMRKEGLRHFEPGEKPIQRKKFDVDRHTQKIMERQMERRRIEI